MTIEERADRFALQIDFNIHKNEGTTEVEQSIRAQGVRRGYIQGATEQDHIARQEERERCIKAAQDTMCDVCERHFTQFCPCEKQSDEDRRTDCWKLERFRKAMSK